jgi:hypothetical protein
MSTFGSSPFSRKFSLVMRDAIKCGYNTELNTESVFPAQDFKMISSFEYRLVNFTGPVSNLINPAAGNTLFPAKVPQFFPTGLPNTVTLAYYKPVMMNYFVFNPCNGTIALDVEVWAWRRGWAIENIGLQDTYFHGYEYETEDVNTALLYNGDERTFAVNTFPQIHSVPISTASTVVNNSRKAEIRQMHDPARLRMRCMKLLSSRKRVQIPPGRIYRFRVMHRLPQGLPANIVSGYAGFGQDVSVQRLVVLKWSTLMGTVPGVLESSHLSEKVHIVVARRATIRGSFVQRVPNLKADLVYSHDGDLDVGTNYLGTAVDEHLAVQEVTKSTQNIENVP